MNHELEQISLLLKEATKRLDDILKKENSEPVETYPYKGTWKDKITFVLKINDEPLTAKEITRQIFAVEMITSNPKFENSITQICSNMARATPPELDKDGTYNIKYSLPKND